MADFIDDLNGKSDDELGKMFGWPDKLGDFKKDLGEAAKLDGEMRADAATRIKRMFEPSVYPGEIRYIVDDVTQRAADKADANDKVMGTPKEEMNKTSPSSLLDE